MNLTRHRPILFYGIVCFLFASLAVYLTWPLAINLDSTLPAGTDSLVHLWNLWWVELALEQGRSPYQTDMLFFPEGISLVYHNFAWVHILSGLLLGRLGYLSQVTVYNLVLLLHLTLCGVIAFALGRFLTQRDDISLLAGLIYLAWPYRLTQPDHPNLHATWPVPLFFLMLIRLVERKRWRDAIWCGLAFGLVGYMRWQLLIPTTLMGILFMIVRALQIRDWNALWVELRYLAVAALAAVVVLSPPIALLAVEYGQNQAQLIPQGEALGMQTDLLAYVTPPPWHSLWGEGATERYLQYYPARGSRFVYSPFIGFLPLLLVLFGLIFGQKKRSWGWFAMGVMLILFALGPVLRVNGVLLERVPTLYPLFDRLAILRLLREPDRFNMLLALPVAVLSAYGALAIIDRWPKLGSSWAILAAGFLILVEYSVVPLPLQTLTISPFYDEISVISDSNPQAGRSPGVIDIPLDPFKSKPYMLAQITHGRPIAQGHASRYPDNAFNFLEGDAWLNETLVFDGQPPQDQLIGVSLGRLAAAGFDYLVIHKGDIRENDLLQWRRKLPISPYFEDQALLVYTTDLARWELSSTQDGPLQPLQIVQSAACFNPASVFGVDISWWLAQSFEEVPLPADLQVRLRLDPANSNANGSDGWGSEPVSLLVGLSDDSGRQVMPPLPTLIEGQYEWDLPRSLALGRYKTDLVLGNDSSGLLPTRIDLGQITLQSEACDYDLPNGGNGLNVRFGDVARLLDYDLVQGEERLDLDLLWRSEQRTGVNFTLFVHLFDLETEAIVAQVDQLARAGAYPTSRWGLDELIDEQLQLDLSHVPAGRYGLGIGLYDAGNGERLPIEIYSDDRLPIEMNRLLIQDEIIILE